MNAKNESEQQCPQADLLSAYFDNELTPEEKKSVDHIQSCTDCKNHLGAFYQIEESIKKSVASSVSTDLSQRILAGVHEKLNQEQEKITPKPILFNPIFLRIAASAIVCLGLGFYVVGRYQLNKTPGTNTEQNNVIAQTAPGESIRFISPEKLGYKADDNNGIPLNDFQTVKYGNATSKSPVTATMNNIKQPTYIKNNVRHVWVVNNLDDVKQDINQFAEKNSIPANKIMITPNYRGSGLQLNMRLTKRQLVDLVNNCNNDGFSLVSSQAPEPNEKTFVGRENAPVQYNAEFVLSKKVD